uniref:maltotransferase domain-containing protein n=1 Tax=Streptomyces sp. NRRL F-6674 TaxID=1463877 RepID=UPI001F40C24C
MPATHHTSATPTTGSPGTTGPAGTTSAGPPGPGTSAPGATPGAAPAHTSSISSSTPGSTPGSSPGSALGSAATSAPAPASAPSADSPTASSPSAPAPAAPVVGRIPVLDVAPAVLRGRRPAKAVVGEEFEISATVFREGHDAVAANVVLTDPEGRPGPWTPMRELAPGTDRWGARVAVPAEGRWTYRVEAWGDPVSTWRHNAGIKVPAGQDTALVLEEGALLYERAAEGLPVGSAQAGAVLRAAVAALRDTGRPPASRLAAALTPEVDRVLARHPLRDPVSASEELPLQVERERALYGSWYEFFPRSENGGLDPSAHGTFRTAGELGLEIALDFALQCSPDHPWVEKHPEWFHHRSDGSIAYAENPPKKYQDIYPIAFDADMDGIVTETVRVLRHWMAHGVRIFRVDNPHTKPVVFWERVIGEINGRDPDVIFL